MELYPQQQEALDAIKIFLASDDQVFILRGYAGTGKTTLIRHIYIAACDNNQLVRLAAPTGRAAHVLQEKTGIKASTIHRCIYALDKIETDEQDPNHLIYFFPLAEPDYANNSKLVTIVDEASMVSTKKQVGEIFRFGTGILLNDLLTSCRPHNGGKIIFIGDPAQLPPVQENVSQALREEYFESKGLKVSSYTLTDIVRQKQDSLILRNSMILRDLLYSTERPWLNLSTDGHEVVETQASQLVPLMLEKFPIPEINQSAIIAPTNKLVRNYNRDVRERVFPNKDHIVAGDIAIICQNSYNVCGVADLMNGDFIKITWVSDNTDSITEKVKTEKDGIVTTVEVTMTFRDVHFINATGDNLSCKIIDSFVASIEPQLTTEHIKALYINFCKRVSKSHPHIKRGSEQFKELLKEDPFYNALRVKYGYAITCHKAQGGEWDTVFVDFDSRVRLSDGDLRWSYTAITRASNCLVAANLPQKELLQSLNVCTISKINTPRVVPTAIPDTPETPFHSVNSNSLLRAKYWSVMKSLSDTDFTIANIESKPWCELYSILSPAGIVRIDCFYNSRNAFTRFMLAKGGNLPQAQELLKIVEQDIHLDDEVGTTFQYEPTTPALNQLYGLMQEICREEDVAITNVKEDLEHYNVVYSLKTSGNYSEIKFFINKKHQFSYAMPASDMGEDDILLRTILENLNK